MSCPPSPGTLALSPSTPPGAGAVLGPALEPPGAESYSLGAGPLVGACGFSRGCMIVTVSHGTGHVGPCSPELTTDITHSPCLQRRAAGRGCASPPTTRGWVRSAGFHPCGCMLALTLQAARRRRLLLSGHHRFCRRCFVWPSPPPSLSHQLARGGSPVGTFSCLSGLGPLLMSPLPAQFSRFSPPPARQFVPVILCWLLLGPVSGIVCEEATKNSLSLPRVTQERHSLQTFRDSSVHGGCVFWK